MDTVTFSNYQNVILAIERTFWRTAAAKEDAIRAAGFPSVTRYYQLAVRLAGDPEALAADPQTVYRMRRICTRNGRSPYALGTHDENGVQ